MSTDRSRIRSTSRTRRSKTGFRRARGSVYTSATRRGCASATRRTWPTTSTRTRGRCSCISIIENAATFLPLPVCRGEGRGEGVSKSPFEGHAEPREKLRRVVVIELLQHVVRQRQPAERRLRFLRH